MECQFCGYKWKERIASPKSCPCCKKTINKEMLERRGEKGKEKERPVKGPPTPTPGTFLLDPSRDPDPYRKAKGKKRKGWKENARKMRKGQKGRP